jgi:hypothetical protein
MSEQNATGSMNAMVGALRSSLGIRAATIGRPERSNQAKTSRQETVEYWARRIMWVLVIITSLWDIAVTFGKHLP